jgi:UDP-N-acetylmuramoyl-tripeptide--D-alanyl-D-alanine ligase
MSINELYEIFLQHPAVETDTRKIKKGDIFFALKGPNFNGNKYAKDALEKGAAYCICDEISDAKSDQVIFVDDVLDTLQQLARKHREQFNIPFIGITGSNGKTTTKELVHAVLSTKYKCYTTKGNLNNHIGVPLTLLSIKKDAEIAVIEMGANHLHEIEGYCRYTMPTHGLITNIGKAHLEGFGSAENIKKAKGELFDYLRANEGTAFINNDYDYLKEIAAGIKNIITYGTEDADYTGKVKNDSTYLEVEITGGAKIGTVKTQLAGNYNLSNVLSAVCIGKTFGVEEEKIKAALENYTPGNSRSQIIKSGTNTIVLDAYNANPSSMKAAIENFRKYGGCKKSSDPRRNDGAGCRQYSGA